MRDILILQLGRLGDLVQTLPLIRRLKQEYPASRITLVCLENFLGVIRNSGGWDRLVPVRLEDTDALVEPGRREAFPDLPPFSDRPEFRETYDAAVTLNPDLGSSILLEKIKADRKYGRIHTVEGELRLLGLWSKYVFAMVGHRVDNLFNLVDIHMGMAGLTPRPQPPSLPVTSARMHEARELLLAAGWRGTRPLVALQTGASDLHRAWDLEHFASLGARLIEGGAEILLLGDAGETERAREAAARIGRPVINLAGKTALPLLSSVVRFCDLLVSNDTGTIHVAAAVGTPTLGLYFSTAYYSETAPYGAGHSVLQVEIPCSPCSASTRCAVQLCRDHLRAEDVCRTVLWLLRPVGEAPALPSTLALYRSRFLSNGTLLYAPVHQGEPSDHYQRGLLGRLAWEGALGLSRDPELEAAWRRAAATEGWRRKHAAFAAVLDRMVEPLRLGLELSGRLRRAFASNAKDQIRPLHGQLSQVGDTLEELGGGSGMSGAYLRFEMMDLDYAGYPELAANLETKYKTLNEWIDRMRGALASL